MIKMQLATAHIKYTIGFVFSYNIFSLKNNFNRLRLPRRAGFKYSYTNVFWRRCTAPSGIVVLFFSRSPTWQFVLLR